MSDASKCPLLYQLNSLQIQPLQSYNSCDTELDPDDILPSDFNNDEPELPIPTPKKESLPIDTNVNVVTAYTPPLAHNLQIRQIRIHSITKHQVDPAPKLQRDLTTVIRAQLDTGADITCTNLVHVLHNYKPYTKSFPCRVRLVGAFGDNGDKNLGTYPLGEGLLHIPASTTIGYIPVCCVYSPHLTSTLLCEDDIIRTQEHLRLRDFTTTIVKYYEAGTFSLTCEHKNKRRQFALHGIITFGNKCYTQPLILPSLPGNHPDANEFNSFDLAMLEDKDFARDVTRGTVLRVELFQQRAHAYLVEQLHSLPHDYTDKSIPDIVEDATDVRAIPAQTECLLWHQQLGHPSNERLYTAHKFIDGVPKFKHFDPILEKCPVCI